MKKLSLYYSATTWMFVTSCIPPPWPNAATAAAALDSISHRPQKAKISSLLSRGIPKISIGLPLPCLIFLMLHPLSQSLHFNLSSSLHLHFYLISVPSASPQLLLTHPKVPQKGFSVGAGRFLFVLPLDRRSTRNISCSLRFLLSSKMDI